MYLQVANNTDIPAVVEILDDAFPVDKKHLQEFVKDNDSVYALKIGDTVVGTATFSVKNDSDGDLKLLAIHKKYRGQGYARYIVDNVVHDLKHKGCTRVYIAATDEVSDMWEHFGFQYVDTFTCSTFGITEVFNGYVKYTHV